MPDIHSRMTHGRLRRLVPAIGGMAGIAMLGACLAAGPETSSVDAGADPPTGPLADTGPASVPGAMGAAPEPVALLADRAIWDGRPTLGGVWIAHDTVEAPQKVLIRAEGQATPVEAVLFRRRAPGAGIQLSSEAAEALGLGAGQVTRLEVLALPTTGPAMGTDVAMPAHAVISTQKKGGTLCSIV